MERARGGPAATAIEWHAKALTIRLALQVPEVVNNLRYLSQYRRELGSVQFASLLNGATGDPGFADAIAPFLDQVEEPETDAD